MNPSCKDFDFLDEPFFLEEFAFGPQKNEMYFYVEGIKCAKCVLSIENLKSPHLQSAQVDFARSLLKIKIKPGTQFAPVIVDLHDLGFSAKPIQSAKETLEKEKIENRKKLIELAVAGAMTGNIMLLSFAVYSGAQGMFFEYMERINGLLFLPIFLYSSRSFFKNSFYSFKNRQISIDFPIATAILVGSFISYVHLFRGEGHIYFDSLSMLVFLLLGARYFLYQVKMKFLSPDYLKSFFQIHVARLAESRRLIPSQKVKEGDHLLILEGETCPTDSTLLSDQAYFQTAVLSGETKPVSLKKGDLCYAGYQLMSPEVKVAALKSLQDSRIGKIIEQVQWELQQKTRFTTSAEKAAQIFTYTLIGVASLFFIIYSFVDIQEAANRALALTILACPCALAFSLPLTHSLGILKMARRGVLVKKSSVFEKLTYAKNLVFDKTGTLTQGHFHFIQWHNKKPSNEDLQIIYALEKQSHHPIGKSLVRSLENKVDPEEAIHLEQWKEVAGVGVSAHISGVNYALKKAPQNFAITSNTFVGLYKGDQITCVAELGDEIKKDVAPLVHNLQSLGLNTFVLSGDQQKTVQEVAQTLNIPERNALANLLPEAKGQWVKDHPHTVVVGDGANDILAFSSSWVSIAVNGSFESSLKTADVYFTTHDMKNVETLIHFSKEIVQVMRRNIVLSIAYNSSGGLAALLGIINPLIAAILMPISSTLVIASCLYGTRKMNQLLKQTPKDIILTARQTLSENLSGGLS